MPYEQLFLADLRRLSLSIYNRPAKAGELLELCESLVTQYEEVLFSEQLKLSDVRKRTIYGKLAFAYECIGKHPEAAHLFEISTTPGMPGGSAGFWSLMGID
jgi:hypothetical protein